MIHVEDSVDPVRDLDIITNELRLKVSPPPHGTGGSIPVGAHGVLKLFSDWQSALS